MTAVTLTSGLMTQSDYSEKWPVTSGHARSLHLMNRFARLAGRCGR